MAFMPSTIQVCTGLLFGLAQPVLVRAQSRPLNLGKIKPSPGRRVFSWAHGTALPSRLKMGTSPAQPVFSLP